MSTQAQICANQANAQKSTGPKTAEGKAASCMNTFCFGFTGVVTVLESEDQDEFDRLFHGLSIEHQVKTMTERVLVLQMAQHHWLSNRAQRLQAAESRLQAAETRKQDHHKFDILLAEAKLDHQLLQNLNLEITNRNAAGTQNRSMEAQQAA